MIEAQRVWIEEKCGHGQCGGDLYLERDLWGRFKKKCLLCSREFELTKRQFGDLKRRGFQL
jgi:hypothetical protein